MQPAISITPAFKPLILIPPPTHLRFTSATHILRQSHVPFSHETRRKGFAAITAARSGGCNSPNPPNPSTSPLKTAAACAVILAAAAFGNFPRHKPALAEIPTLSETLIEEATDKVTQQRHEGNVVSPISPLAQLLESKSDAIEALKKLLQEKLEAGEDEESLSILKNLSSAQPENLEWKFLMARVSSEIGRLDEARVVFEEILARNPFCFPALFENALLMDRSGERTSVMKRLKEAYKVAEDEGKPKEARDVRLIMAQMQFLHKDVDGALRSYEELLMEDPLDFRPYFCKGVIYSLMDRNVEAREQFAKYREFSPKKFEVEGYLRTPLSRMNLFRTGEDY